MQEQKIPQGYKKTEIGIIPQDWEVYDLKRISTLKARIGWQGLKKSEYLTKGDYYLITGTDFENGQIIWDNVVFVSKKRYEQDKNIQIKKEDILITKDGSIGKIAYVCETPPKPSTLNSGIFVVRPKNYVYIPLFGFYLFHSKYFKRFLEKLSAGSTISHLYQKDFVNFIFPLPPLSEQRAIARVLSDVDRLIESLDKLIEKKKMMKKGAMQELLTGKRRLPGFTGEWVKKKLGEIAEIKKGDLITEKTAKKGNIPVIGGGIEPTYYHNRSNRGPNTITISASGANAGYVNFYPYPIFASDCSTIEENNNYDVKFLYHFLKLKQNDIIKLQTGGAQPHVYPEQLKNLMIYFPPTLEEQQAIAQILSDMDAEIEALEKKKEKYEMIKKGLMEQLLTGKIRLKNNIKGW